MTLNGVNRPSAKLWLLLLPLSLSTACVKKSQTNVENALTANRFGFDVLRTAQKRYLFHGHRAPYNCTVPVQQEVVREMVATMDWASKPVSDRQVIDSMSFGPALYTMLSPTGYGRDYMAMIEIPAGTEFIKDYTSAEARAAVETDEMRAKFPLWYCGYGMIRSPKVVNVDTIKVFAMADLDKAAASFDSTSIPTYTPPASYEEALEQTFSGKDIPLYQMWKFAYTNDRWVDLRDPERRDARAIEIVTALYPSALMSTLKLRGDTNLLKSIHSLIEFSSANPLKNSPSDWRHEGKDLNDLKTLGLLAPEVTSIMGSEIVTLIANKIRAADPSMMPKLYSHLDTFAVFKDFDRANEHAWDSMEGMEAKTTDKTVRSHDVKTSDGTESNTIDAETIAQLPDPNLIDNTPEAGDNADVYSGGRDGADASGSSDAANSDSQDRSRGQLGR